MATTLDVAPDWRVALFTLAVSLTTGLLFGLLPALRTTQVSVAEALKAQARSVAGGGPPGASASRLLVSGQIAVSLLLLVVAALFVRSLQQLVRTDVGYDRARVLVARVDPRAGGFTVAEQPELQRRLMERVLALPGVTAASLSGNGPFSGSRTTSSMEVQGYAHDRGERLRTQEDVVTPEYFGTLGLRIVRGRGFASTDTAASRNVSVINETMARRYFGSADPIGRRWSYDSDFGANAFEIVGVVADARYNDVRADSLNMAYRPLAQSDWFAESLEVRTAGDPALLVPTLLAALREAEPRLPVTAVETLDARVTRSLGQERMLTWLASIFGGVALALACLGLYGTISYGVARRTSELGLRIALGANRPSVIWLILRDALGVVTAGLGVGLPLAVISSRALGGLLYGVDVANIVPYVYAALALLAVTLLAAYIPARRASRLDPVAALRADQ